MLGAFKPSTLVIGQGPEFRYTMSYNKLSSHRAFFFLYLHIRYVQSHFKKKHISDNACVLSIDNKVKSFQLPWYMVHRAFNSDVSGLGDVRL